MENYVNKIGEVAKKELEELGFKNIILKPIESELEEGVVVRQSVDVGTIVEKEQEITLFVSNGKFKISVPNFTRLTLDEVEAWAKQYKIIVKHTYVCDDTFEEGTIISQNPGYGVNIQNKSTIEVVISGGKCESQ